MGEHGWCVFYYYVVYGCACMMMSLSTSAALYCQNAVEAMLVFLLPCVPFLHLHADIRFVPCVLSLDFLFLCFLCRVVYFRYQVRAFW